jgi:hypothetical protein
MQPNEWAATVVAVITIVITFFGFIRWLVKTYLSELKPNGGSSLSDRVNRLEGKVDQIYYLLIMKGKDE